MEFLENDKEHSEISYNMAEVTKWCYKLECEEDK